MIANSTLTAPSRKNVAICVPVPDIDVKIIVFCMVMYWDWRLASSKAIFWTFQYHSLKMDWSRFTKWSSFKTFCIFLFPFRTRCDILQFLWLDWHLTCICCNAASTFFWWSTKYNWERTYVNGFSMLTSIWLNGLSLLMRESKNIPVARRSKHIASFLWLEPCFSRFLKENTLALSPIINSKVLKILFMVCTSSVSNQILHWWKFVF